MKAAQSLLLCLVSVLAQSGGLAQPDDLARKSQRAKELMAEGKFVQAIPLYRELIQAVPNNPGLMLNLGMALHMAGKEREAIPELEAATKLDPTLAPAWLFPFIFLYGGPAADRVGHADLFFWFGATPLFFWSFSRASAP